MENATTPPIYPTLPGPIALLKSALSLFKKHIAHFLLISAIPALLYTAIAVFAPDNQGLFVAAIGIISVIIGIYSAAALTLAGLDAYQGQPVNPQDAFARAGKLFIPFLGLTILQGLIVSGGTVLLIIPGIVLGIYFMFSGLVFFTTGTTGLAALLTSKAYVKDYGLAVFGRLFVMGIIFIVPVIILSAIASPFGEQAGTVIETVTSFILQPIIVLFDIALFKELQKLKGMQVVAPLPKQKTGYYLLAALGALAAIGFILGMSYLASLEKTQVFY